MSRIMNDLIYEEKPNTYIYKKKTKKHKNHQLINDSGAHKKDLVGPKACLFKIQGGFRVLKRT
jgi:hypothetical protein